MAQEDVVNYMVESEKAGWGHNPFALMIAKDLPEPELPDDWEEQYEREIHPAVEEMIGGDR